jgi:hypothetical protein
VENFRKKNQTEILELESSLNQILKKYNWKTLQQTRTSGRQNFRAWEQNRY